MKSFKIDGDEEIFYELCTFLIMASKSTPKSQPIDTFIANKFKGVMKEYYDDYMFYAD